MMDEIQNSFFTAAEDTCICSNAFWKSPRASIASTVFQALKGAFALCETDDGQEATIRM